MPMTKKEKRVIANFLYRQLVMGEGRTGNPYACKEMKELIKLGSGTNDGLSDEYKQFVSSELIAENERKCR